MTPASRRAALTEYEYLIRLAGRALAEPDPGTSKAASELMERVGANELAQDTLVQLWLTTLVANGSTTTEMYLWADHVKTEAGRRHTWTGNR